MNALCFSFFSDLTKDLAEEASKAREMSNKVAALELEVAKLNRDLTESARNARNLQEVEAELKASNATLASVQVHIACSPSPVLSFRFVFVMHMLPFPWMVDLYLNIFDGLCFHIVVLPVFVF